MSDTPSLDALLAAAVRGGAVADSAGEARAVAAFREARERGPGTARTRRRDDWRPNARRRLQLSVRTTLAVLLASLTLGGVAFAAIGSAARDDNGTGGDHGGRDRRPRTTDGAPSWPGSTNDPRTTPSLPSTSDRPDTAGETEADCRAYEKKTGSSGKGSGLSCPTAADGRRDEERTSPPDKAERPTDNGEGEGGGQGRSSEPSASNKPSEPGEPGTARESSTSNEPNRPSASGGRQGQADEARKTK
ncbi:hypothetical protein JIX56_16335 [Streptomyces sp. CA-210063]|uniref:hypothetical protein n=1 Tax=Streptomyces sp. CA-210063 TaxID=2801029 RepID=UPI00214CFCB4|nr:hypothetical protein [Streptomyces sp. CA-210063]UUU31345.1 hypothetical protein JIX56_16335 [Streptomyces sp. CA-210063]